MANLLTLLVAFCSLTALAELDAASQEALRKTMEMLVTPGMRASEIDRTKEGKQADAFAQSVGGNAANTQKLYELAAKVMETLVHKTKGDPDKMMKLMEDAQRNPSAFADTFTPEQRKLLKELAADIEKTKGTPRTP